MRGAIVFGGTSHPKLVEGICDRLGMKPGSATLGKFKNGETSVTIRMFTCTPPPNAALARTLTARRYLDPKQGCLHRPERKREVRSPALSCARWLMGQNQRLGHGAADYDLGLQRRLCKVGHRYAAPCQAQWHLLTPPAVMPYFPYSRQSKKKQHRGAITARMVANLLHIAGVSHVMTIDLHASQMQGFFKCPVDNLVAEPLIARWIRVNVPNWREAVVVSKNPGGTKRVTSLADALKLSFGIVTTDRRRADTAVHWNESAMFEQLRLDGAYETPDLVRTALDSDADVTPISSITIDPKAESGKSSLRRTPTNPLVRRLHEQTGSHPLSKSMRAGSIVEPEVPLEPIRTDAENHDQEVEQLDGEESDTEEYTDEVCPCHSFAS